MCVPGRICTQFVCIMFRLQLQSPSCLCQSSASWSHCGWFPFMLQTLTPPAVICERSYLRGRVSALSVFISYLTYCRICFAVYPSRSDARTEADWHHCLLTWHCRQKWSLERERALDHKAYSFSKQARHGDKCHAVQRTKALKWQRWSRSVFPAGRLSCSIPLKRNLHDAPFQSFLVPWEL